MSYATILKRLGWGLSFALLATILPVQGSANDGPNKTLEQGFRGIPWHSSKKILEQKGFTRVTDVDPWFYSHGFVEVYNFDDGAREVFERPLSNNTEAIFKFKKLDILEKKKIIDNIQYYENKNDNLSLGKHIKFKKIHYIVHDGLFSGVCLHIDNEKSNNNWEEIFASMFKGKEFHILRKSSPSYEYNIAKISKYTKVAYFDNGFVILQMPKKIQDIIDNVILKVKEEKKKKEAMTGGTF